MAAAAAAAFLGVIFLVALTTGQDVYPLEIVDNCMNQTHLPAELYAEIQNGTFEDIPVVQAFIKCKYTEYGAITKDGQINETATDEIYSTMPTGQNVTTEQRLNAANDCYQVMIEKETLGEQCVAYDNCYFKTIPSDRSIIFPDIPDGDS